MRSASPCTKTVGTYQEAEMNNPSPDSWKIFGWFLIFALLGFSLCYAPFILWGLWQLRITMQGLGH